jgi:hypothetical protein
MYSHVSILTEKFYEKNSNQAIRPCVTAMCTQILNKFNTTQHKIE